MFTSRKQIAHDLGISEKTLRRRLSESGIMLSSGLLSEAEQSNIITYLSGQRRTKADKIGQKNWICSMAWVILPRFMSQSLKVGV